MKRHSLLVAIKITISSLLVYILINQIGGLKAFSDTLKEASLSWCLLGASAALINILLSGLKIWLLLKAAKIDLPIFSFMNLFIYSYCFSLVLPGQTGDAVITLFLRKHNVPISTSGACYIIDKVMTLGLMLLISAYGCHILIPNVPGYIFVICAFSLILSTIAVIKLIRYLPTPKTALLIKIKQELVQLNEIAATVVRKKFYILINFLLTIINWGVLGFSYYFVFRGLHHIVAWPMVGIVPIMSGLVGYLPISIAGLGTVEYSAVYLFSLLGTSKAVVLGVYFIQRLIQYCLAATLVVLFFLFRLLGFAAISKFLHSNNRNDI